MKPIMTNKYLFYYLLIALYIQFGCNNHTSEIMIDKIVIDDEDPNYGYYHAVKPKLNVDAVLFLLPGFGQKSEDIFLDSKLPELAFENGILTIGFSGIMRLTADSLLTNKIDQVVSDVLDRYGLDSPFVVFGGFSAGGTIALRYSEKCLENPDLHPTKPGAIFMVDSPVDLFYSWELAMQNMRNNYSEITVNEAKHIEKVYRHYYGTVPSENPETFRSLSPFSMDTILGRNEATLIQTPLRTYHDIDVKWRLENRNQTVRNSNYLVSSELINRLLLLGNTNAEFIQSHNSGYRRNGDRHPHSWSIVDDKECIYWILNEANNKS